MCTLKQKAPENRKEKENCCHQSPKAHLPFTEFPTKTTFERGTVSLVEENYAFEQIVLNTTIKQTRRDVLERTSIPCCLGKVKNVFAGKITKRGTPAWQQTSSQMRLWHNRSVLYWSLLLVLYGSPQQVTTDKSPPVLKGKQNSQMSIPLVIKKGLKVEFMDCPELSAQITKSICISGFWTAPIVSWPKLGTEILTSCACVRCVGQPNWTSHVS